ncbi:MAG: TIGR03545 family protein [Elusimicrobiota bacterium]|mgnify:CR=1 FL=1
MIRWSYLAPRLILAAILWAFCALAMDPLLERGLEKAGSRSLGARVGMSRLRTGIFPPFIEISSFDAADPSEPMKNLIEFQRLRMNLEGRPLLEKKLAGSAELSGLRWGTPRSRSGALPKAPPSKASAALSDYASRSKDIGLGAATQAKTDLSARYSVKPEDLKSLAMAKDLKAAWPGRMKAWRERVDGFDAEGKARELKLLVDKASASQDLPSRLGALRELQQKSSALKGGLGELKSSLASEMDKAKEELRAVEAAKAADLEGLRGKLNLPRFDAKTLSSYLLGGKTASGLEKALRLLELARKHMPAKGQTPEPALRGEDVPFPKEFSLPAFHLKTMKLSGSMDLGGPLDFSGEVLDLTTEPALLGRPAVLELRGASGGRSIELKAELDHTGETASERIFLKGRGFPVAELQAGDPSSFAVAVSPGVASFSGELTLEGQKLRGKLSLEETGIRVEPQAGSVSKAVEEALRSSLSRIDKLSAVVELSGELDSPELSLSSNIGDAVSQALKQALGAELQARTKTLEGQVDKLVGEETRGLTRSMDEGTKDILARLGLGDSKLRELQDSIGQKLRLPGSGLPDLKKLFR